LQITKVREQPFSFWDREKEKQMLRRSGTEADGLNIECTRPNFKANPIPKACSVLIYEKKLAEEEIKR